MSAHAHDSDSDSSYVDEEEDDDEDEEDDEDQEPDDAERDVGQSLRGWNAVLDRNVPVWALPWLWRAEGAVRELLPLLARFLSYFALLLLVCWGCG
jgi:hypothetical protein